MATRGNHASSRPPAGRAAKETPRERHERMMLDIDAFMAEIDATLAECGKRSPSLAALAEAEAS